MEQYQMRSKSYRISIHFSSKSSSFGSIKRKMELLKQVNTLKADNKVSMLNFKISKNNKWNDEILKLMMKRYTNVY